MGRVAKVPGTLAGLAEADHQIAARVDHQHGQIAVGPVPDVQVALVVESDGCDPGQQLPIAHAVADAVDLGEFGVEESVFNGEFDEFLGGGRAGGEGQCGKGNPDRVTGFIQH